METFKNYLITEKIQNFLKGIIDNNKKYKDRSKFLIDFNDNGGDILGIGAFGVALAHDKWGYNKVVKIFNYDDVCYTAFIRFCFENNSKFLPKIYNKPVKFVPPWGYRTEPFLYFIVMERLECGRGLHKDVKEYLDLHYNLRRNSDDMDHETSKTLEKRMESISSKYDDFEEFIRFYMLYKRKYPKFSKDHNCTEDLHYENIMLRGNQPVITDPYASFDMPPEQRVNYDYTNKNKTYDRIPYTIHYKPGKRYLTRGQKSKIPKTRRK